MFCQWIVQNEYIFKAKNTGEHTLVYDLLHTFHQGFEPIHESSYSWLPDWQAAQGANTNRLTCPTISHMCKTGAVMILAFSTA